MRLSNRHIIFLIIIFSTVLRFYRFTDIPFMHDEFSALNRTEFSSFNEMIDKGVKPDAHPAGVQTFLYYWTKIFGEKEWIVKLPFLIMGVLSVWLVYLVAGKWYNDTTGLLCAAYMCAIQYTIMYSQIARPYISGLFLSLLMVYYWSRLMAESTKRFWRKAIPYIIASALCAYNHHFSLLFAAIVGLSGVFIIPRQQFLKYILCGLIIFLFYLPHLEIFLVQLKTGGVGGWLSSPDLSFFINYIHYIFNYSLYSIFLLIFIIMGGFLLNGYASLSVRNYTLSATWFVLPALIGYIYSVKVSPVLQFSVLLFSFFPLLFLLLGHYPLLKPKFNLIIVISILTVNTFTLITERNHFKIFYNSPFEQIVLDYKNFKNDYPNGTALIDSHNRITDYYLKRHHVDSSFASFHRFQGPSDLIQYLNEDSKTYETLYFGALSSNLPTTVPIILQHFPSVLQEQNYYGGTTWIFSKTGEPTQATISNLDFSYPAVDNWSSIIPEQIKEDESQPGNYCYIMDSSIEWSPTFTIPVNEIINHQNNYIDLSVDFQSLSDLNEVIIVATLEIDGEVSYFSSADLKMYLQNTNPLNVWVTAHHSLKLSDINLNFNKVWLKFFIWNKGKDDLLIDNFRISVREGNPIVYSLYEKIP